jgi:hypothetical protein
MRYGYRREQTHHSGRCRRGRPGRVIGFSGFSQILMNFGLKCATQARHVTVRVDLPDLLGARRIAGLKLRGF